MQEKSLRTAHCFWGVLMREMETSQAGDNLPWDSSTLLSKSWSEMRCHPLQKHIPNNSSSVLTRMPSGCLGRATTEEEQDPASDWIQTGAWDKRRGNLMSESAHEKKWAEINRLVWSTVFLFKKRKSYCKLRLQVRGKALRKARELRITTWNGSWCSVKKTCQVLRKAALEGGILAGQDGLSSSTLWGVPCQHHAALIQCLALTTLQHLHSTDNAPTEHCQHFEPEA